MGIRSVAFLESCDTPVSGVTKAADKNLSILERPAALLRDSMSRGRSYPSPRWCHVTEQLPGSFIACLWSHRARQHYNGTGVASLLLDTA